MGDCDKVVDSELAINCKDHNKPAVFFSKKLGSWRCFKCMLSQEDLVYVDKQYKSDMEEYESIKKMTHRVVVENGPSGQLIGNWKKGIRETLIDVRAQFNEWINAFTIRFVDKLNKIEHSREMSQYADQDRFITSQVRELENKYTRILNIFTDI